MYIHICVYKCICIHLNIMDIVLVFIEGTWHLFVRIILMGDSADKSCVFEEFLQNSLDLQKQPWLMAYDGVIDEARWFLCVICVCG